jgi:hypothetical protein
VRCAYISATRPTYARTARVRVDENRFGVAAVLDLDPAALVEAAFFTGIVFFPGAAFAAAAFVARGLVAAIFAAAYAKVSERS